MICYSFSDYWFTRNMEGLNNTVVDPVRNLGSARKTQSANQARSARQFAHLVRAWLVEPVLRAYLRRKLFRQLVALDDRMLEDIGLTRAEIPGLVKRSYGSASVSRHTLQSATVHRLAVKRPPLVTPKAPEHEQPRAA